MTVPDPEIPPRPLRFLGDGDWVVFARWRIGEISNAEYADHLEARGDGGPGDPGGRILIDHLRKEEPS